MCHPNSLVILTYNKKKPLYDQTMKTTGSWNKTTLADVVIPCVLFCLPDQKTRVSTCCVCSCRSSQQHFSYLIIHKMCICFSSLVFYTRRERERSSKIRCVQDMNVQCKARPRLTIAERPRLFDSFRAYACTTPDGKRQVRLCLLIQLRTENKLHD